MSVEMPKLVALVRPPVLDKSAWIMMASKEEEDQWDAEKAHQKWWSFMAVDTAMFNLIVCHTQMWLSVRDTV